MLRVSLFSWIVANGASLVGPSMMAPFVVRVGVKFYLVTGTGKPYGMTIVMIFSGLPNATLILLVMGTRRLRNCLGVLVQKRSML